jgi:hypothetical protein
MELLPFTVPFVDLEVTLVRMVVVTPGVGVVGGGIWWTS